MNVVTARLAKLATADGLFEFQDNVPLGREYVIDLDSQETHVYWNFERRLHHKKSMVRDVVNGGWLPIECLAFEVTP